MLDKIQSLIDAGNTVVYQCIKYNYAFVIDRVITSADNDLYIGFKHQGTFSRPEMPACKQSVGSMKSVAKFFLVQTGDKEYEVFDTEKNYRSGKRVEKCADYDKLREMYKSQLVYTYTYDDKVMYRRKEKTIQRKMMFTYWPNMQAPTLEHAMKTILLNSKQENVSNLKFESVRPVTEVDAKM